MKFLLTGSSGFLGSAFMDYFDNHFSNYAAVNVEDLAHDQFYQRGTTHLFHFASPSSQILFKEDASCIKETIDGFIKVVEYCKRKRIKLIFPSSATIYTSGNAYSHTKMALESIAKAYGIDYLALRISASYGPGEEHKKDYASIIYQWAKQIKNDETPIIWGDGTQTRDFIYIDDVVEATLGYLQSSGTIDIATGINTPFNRIVELLARELSKDVKIEYVKAPKNYFEETVCPNPIKYFISIEEGIKKLCHELKY